jgi:hypothetical protein
LEKSGRIWMRFSDRSFRHKKQGRMEQGASPMFRSSVPNVPQ